MSPRSILSSLAALAVLWPALGAAQGFIVKDGKPCAEIILAEKPAPMARLAASELQLHIEKMTGARLPITASPGPGVNIYVGRGAHTEKLGLKTDGLAHGAYRVASGKDWLALLGPDKTFSPVEPYAHRWTGGSGGKAERDRVEAEFDKISGGVFLNPFNYVFPYWSEELQLWEFDDAGTLNAAHDFLRGLGVRWYFPGELGEVIPKVKDIALPAVDKTVRPDFPLRKLGWWARRNSMTPEEKLWNLRLGVNEGADLIGLTQLCHGIKFVIGRDEVKKAHPDYYALWGGKRATDHKSGQGAPCLSSEGLFAEHLKYARAVFNHYREPMLSVDVVDGYSTALCECEKCKDKGKPDLGWEGRLSDYVIGYADRVARELHKSHPDRMVSALAYGSYRLPPVTVETLSPNMAMWLCHTRMTFGDTAIRDHWRQLRKAWLEKLPSKQLFIYEYYLAGRPGGAWEGLPAYYPRLIAEDLRSLKGVSQGEYIDLYQPATRGERPYDYLALNHLNLYVTARLWWDASQDLDAMLEEYYAGFYGPARAEMKAFIEHGERNWPNMRKDIQAIDKSLELLAAARNAAGDTIYGQRIDLAARYVEPMKLLRKQLANPREGVPSARALQRSDAGLKIDGKLDDPIWETVRLYQLSEIKTGKPPTCPTTFRIGWAGDALCLGITCKDPDMANLKIGSDKPDDPSVWLGDVVEVLIETQVHSYYQIAVSPSGAVTDLDRDKGLGASWNSGAQVATRKEPDGWTVEIRIPVAGENAADIDPLLGVAGKPPSDAYPWFVNICRQRIRGKDVELSAWSPTGKPRFNVPEKFGKVYIK